MELTRFQKWILLALAGMLALFSILMAVFRSHPGVLFEEDLLKITEHGGQTVYTGRAYGTPVAITVTCPTNFRSVVTFSIPGVDAGAYEVLYPLEPLRTERGDAVGGIRVLKDGAVFYEGGYDRESGRWYDADGSFHSWMSVRAYGSDPWWGYETSAADVVRFAFGPDTAAHGHPGIFALAAFLSVLLALEVVFHRQLFRWRHWAARDPEPSDEYLVLERAGWVILAAVVAALYLWAMAEIY